MNRDPRLSSILCAALALGAPALAQGAPCFEPNFGTNLNLGDDALASNLALGFAFPFPGGSSSAIDVASNGSIWVQTNPNNTDRCCFGDPIALLSDGPSINPLWMDLDPSSGGAVWFNTFPNRAVITWDAVPEYGGILGMTFQVQLLSDGSITFWWDASTSSGFGSALVGVSPGSNAVDPGQSDLSSGVISTNGDPTIYELFDQFVATPFDLSATSIQLVPAGNGWLLLPRTNCAQAKTATYGNGCPRPPVVYELFPAGTIDLSNASFLVAPTSNGYTVSACAQNCFETNFTGDLLLSDDSTSGPLSLGFTFNYPGGSTASIDVSSNGFLWIDGVASTGDSRCCNGDVPTFLADLPSICALWMDLNPSSGGAVHFATFPGRAVVTWDQVHEFGGTNPNTAQIQLFANGSFLLSYGSVSSTGHDALTGFAGVFGASDPGNTDLTAAIPFSLGSTGTPVGLDAAPASRPILGTTFSMDVSNAPAGTLLGIVGVGVFQISTDLTVIGMPGCSLLQSNDATLPLPITPPIATTSLPIPNVSAFTGLVLYAQAILVSPGVNALGLVTSNGLAITLGQ